MCGRYILHAEPNQLAAIFGLPEFSETPNDFRPRFNIAPSQGVPIVRNQPGRDLTIIRRAGEGISRELVTVRWGLIPWWAKDPGVGYKTINARAESIAEKPAFRDAFKA